MRWSASIADVFGPKSDTIKRVALYLSSHQLIDEFEWRKFPPLHQLRDQMILPQRRSVQQHLRQPTDIETWLLISRAALSYNVYAIRSCSSTGIPNSRTRASILMRTTFLWNDHLKLGLHNPASIRKVVVLRRLRIEPGLEEEIHLLLMTLETGVIKEITHHYLAEALVMGDLEADTYLEGVVEVVYLHHENPQSHLMGHLMIQVTTKTVEMMMTRITTPTTTQLISLLGTLSVEIDTDLKRQISEHMMLAPGIAL